MNMLLKKWRTPLLLLLVIAGLSLISPLNVIGESSSSNVLSAQGEPDSEFMAYIHSVKQEDGSVQLVVDPISWYTGAAADQIFKEQDPEAYAEIGGTLDGYYIVNNTEEQLPYSAVSSAEVFMQLYDRGDGMASDIQWNEPITLNSFIKVFNKTDVLDVSAFPYRLTVQDGQIVKIVQQYVP